MQVFNDPLLKALLEKDRECPVPSVNTGGGTWGHFS